MVIDYAKAVVDDVQGSLNAALNRHKGRRASCGVIRRLFLNWSERLSHRREKISYFSRRIPMLFAAVKIVLFRIFWAKAPVSADGSSYSNGFSSETNHSCKRSNPIIET